MIMKKVLTRVMGMMLAAVIALGIVPQAVPVFAATAVKYSMASAITVKEGESKTLKITATPANSDRVINVEWCNASAAYISTSNCSFGSYWGQDATCKVTGKEAGTAYVYATVKEYDKKTDKLTRKVELKCKVTIGQDKAQTVPLTRIYLNKTSATLAKGKTLKLTIGYVPSNTTGNRTAVWSSSNTSVATVKNGVVTAKKAGTATITAKVGNKKTTCKITVKAADVPKEDNYQNVNEAYTQLNEFRTSKNVWMWNENNKTKTYFNTNSKNKLTALKRNTKLEEVARKRAQQIAMYYEKTGELDHKRVDGKPWYTDYRKVIPSGAISENIAYTWAADCIQVTEAWKETNEKYAGQGHRRAMLNSNYNSIGIACYKYKDRYFWVQAFGYVK